MEFWLEIVLGGKIFVYLFIFLNCVHPDIYFVTDIRSTQRNTFKNKVPIQIHLCNTKSHFISAKMTGVHKFDGFSHPLHEIRTLFFELLTEPSTHGLRSRSHKHLVTNRLVTRNKFSRLMLTFCGIVQHKWRNIVSSRLL